MTGRPKYRVLLGIWFCMASLSAAAGGWGPTFAIEVNGDGFDEPLLITDPHILDGLSFWIGPGSGGSRPGQPSAFIVGYELDPAHAAGFIYYPRSNYIVTHGGEGNWYYASDKWNEMVGSRVVDNSFTGVPGEFTCSPSRRTREPAAAIAGSCWPGRAILWPQ